MLFSFDSFVYRTARSRMIKLVVLMTNYTTFDSFYYAVTMFIVYIVCVVVKLAINFIFFFLVYTLYFASSHFSVTYQFYASILLRTYFYILLMLVDVNTWRAVIGLLVNTTQQSAVFHLSKCRDSTLYSMLLFLLLLIVFKEFSNNRDLILGTFFIW